tara:strand:- start:207 stop:425 length:219 start_codon:yes stop_codon:yes gene_type:complete
MPKVITSKARDEYLRQHNRFYQIGWLDAERGDTMQVSMVLTTEGDNQYEDDYIAGYNESMSNQFTLEGQADG